MIIEHTKLGTIEVMPPDIQSKHYGCQLQVMSGVVSLMNLKLP